MKKASSPAPSASATPKPGATNEAGTESKKNHSLRWILVGAAAFALLITILTFPQAAGNAETAKPKTPA